jgi:hypothetical protein
MIIKKRNLIFIISSIILIPIILGLTPVKLVQKLVSGCPFQQHNAALSCTPCIYNTVTSQNETDNLTLAVLPTTYIVFQSMPSLSRERVDSVTNIVLNHPSEAPPLRC